jgi:AraC-like DNA-binding protein
MVFASLLRTMEAVVGHRLDRIEVEFPFSEPDWRHEIGRLCTGRLRFGRPDLAFHIDTTLLQSPCITADAEAFAMAYQQCEQLAFQTTLLPLKQRVSELLTAREGAYPSLGEVAKHLGMSDRTLMRRLKQESSSYQALLDATRQQRAVWYLSHSKLTIEEIAGRLGFEDTSNFSRIFKRWLGCPPSAMRRGAHEKMKNPTGTR